MSDLSNNRGEKQFTLGARVQTNLITVKTFPNIKLIITNTG